MGRFKELEVQQQDEDRQSELADLIAEVMFQADQLDNQLDDVTITPEVAAFRLVDRDVEGEPMNVMVSRVDVADFPLWRVRWQRGEDDVNDGCVVSNAHAVFAVLYV